METVVCISFPDTKMENKNLLINKQLLTEDVYSANIFNTVKNRKIIISVLNISEVMQNINMGQVNKLSYECDIENKGDEIRTVNNDDNRVGKLKELIRSDNLNEEKRELIVKIYKQYADIFYL